MFTITTGFDYAMIPLNINRFFLTELNEIVVNKMNYKARANHPFNVLKDVAVIDVIDSPVIPIKKSKPQWMPILLGRLLIEFLFGMAGAFFGKTKRMGGGAILSQPLAG